MNKNGVKINFSELRNRMVDEQLIARGIRDTLILSAMRKVKRELFVPKEYRAYAYEDRPLPIGFGQTISQPYIVGFMCELLELKGNEKVLDIGTGSGYQAAVLSYCARKIVSIEVIKNLYLRAKLLFAKLQLRNILVVCADGKKGYKKEALYDGIICAAATKEIPQAWKDQIKEGGKIVFPKQKRFNQELVVIEKNNGKFKEKNYGNVVFVPLI